jgi:alpha-amylase
MSGRVMMWANMRRGESLAVPAPFDDNSSPYWWYDRIAGWARGWSRTGITDVLFPNPIKGQSGAYRTGDGYNPFDDGDIGSKDQLGRKPTRFGDADQLRRAIAICKANGLNVLLDHVMHQRMGGKNGVYRYVSATGKTNGRFPKDPGCFSPSAPGDTIPPYVPVDPVPDQADNFPFGNPLAPVNSIPKGYVWNGLLQAADWLFRTTGADGARLDDMKGMNVGFMRALMDYGPLRGKFFVAEFASGNPNDLNWWINQVNGRASVADFAFHYNQALRMCNDSTYDMGRLKNTWDTLYQQNPMKAVPFVESMDSDTNGFATIVFNKMLGYALMLTSEGLPCVYIRDYLKEPDCYGLEDGINNLIWCAQMLAGGSTVPRLTNNPRVYVFERMGWGEAPGCLVALSNDYFNPSWHTVTVQTHFGPNAHLHDFTGHNAQDCWTDSQGRAAFGVPPAAGGVGFGVWGPASMQGAVHHAPHPRSTLQDFDGADDLDIGPLDRGSKYIGRVWAEAGTYISMLMEPNTLQGFSTEQRIASPDGLTLVSGKSTHVYGKTKERGWHSLYAQMLTGATPTMPFTLHAEYTAPQTLDVSEFGS